MCQMHPNSDVQLWNYFFNINPNSTHQKWMKFIFIVTGSIFLQSYWVSDNVFKVCSSTESALSANFFEITIHQERICYWAAEQQILWVIALWWILIPFLWPSGSLLLPVPSSQSERYLHFALIKLCQASWMWYHFCH